MPTTTPNLGLQKPNVGSDADTWGNALNATIDTLDTKVFDKTVGGSVTGNVSVTGAVSGGTFSGAGTGLTGTAAGLSIGGNAATATTATNVNGGAVNATTGTFSGTVTAPNFVGPGTGLTGTAAGLSIGGNAANATNAEFAVTQPTGTSNTRIATTAFVTQAAFNSALPAQTGNAGRFITTDGTNASWAPPEVNNAKAYYFSAF